MSKLIKGSRVRNLYDPRIVGTVIAFKKIKRRMFPVVHYDYGEKILEQHCELASKKYYIKRK